MYLKKSSTIIPDSTCLTLPLTGDRELLSWWTCWDVVNRCWGLLWCCVVDKVKEICCCCWCCCEDGGGLPILPLPLRMIHLMFNKDFLVNSLVNTSKLSWNVAKNKPIIINCNINIYTDYRGMITSAPTSSPILCECITISNLILHISPFWLVKKFVVKPKAMCLIINYSMV